MRRLLVQSWDVSIAQPNSAEDASRKQSLQRAPARLQSWPFSHWNSSSVFDLIQTSLSLSQRQVIEPISPTPVLSFFGSTSADQQRMIVKWRPMMTLLSASSGLRHHSPCSRLLSNWYCYFATFHQLPWPKKKKFLAFIGQAFEYSDWQNILSIVDPGDLQDVKYRPNRLKWSDLEHSFVLWPSVCAS